MPILEDKAALQDLLIDYAYACDGRDWARYRSLFTPDALIDYSGAYGRVGVPDAIAPWLGAIMTEAALLHTQHMLSNFRVEVAGDAAAGRVQYLNPDVLQSGDTRSLIVNGGCYTFEAVRAGAGWLLSRLAARILWSARGELLTALTVAGVD